MTTTIEIKVPDSILQVLGIDRKNLSKLLKLELATHYFEKGKLSFGQAREMAEVSVYDFIDFLRQRGIPLHYDLAELEDDLQTIERLSGKR